jgi:hypothetical protein
MAVVDNAGLEVDTMVDQGNEYSDKESEKDFENHQVSQADEDEVDIESRWVEVERNPVVWHTVEKVSAERELESNENERPASATEEKSEIIEITENENVPDRIINIGAHAIVEDVLKQALAQTEENSDAPLTPRLVRTESGNMVIVKMEETGALEERYELMEFELYEQYMKEKGTFSPFQLEFPCDVENVFSSHEGDEPFVPPEELEYIGEDEEDEVDYGSERPLLDSHLSIIMEEPPSGTESLSGSLVKLQINESPPTAVGDNSGEYVITSPSEFDIVQSTVREVQNGKHKTEIDSSDNPNDVCVPTTEDEFMVLWRSHDLVVKDDDEQPVEDVCPQEQENIQETLPADFYVGDVVQKQENVSQVDCEAANDNMEYLKLNLQESPDAPSESSVSPGSSVRSWISSELSSLDDETTCKHPKHYGDDHGIYTTEEENLVLESVDSAFSPPERDNYENLGLESVDSAVSPGEQGNNDVVEQISEEQMVEHYSTKYENKQLESEDNSDCFQEQVIPPELEHPHYLSETCTEHVSVSTEQEGDKKVTRVVRTETTRKLVKIIDGQDFSKGEDLEQYEAKFSGMWEKESVLDEPVIISEANSRRTITTVVTHKEETRPAVISEEACSMVKEVLAKIETEGVYEEHVVPSEEQEDDWVKFEISSAVTQNVEMGPTSNVDDQVTEVSEYVEKQRTDHGGTASKMINKEQENDRHTLKEIIDKAEKETPQYETELTTEELDEDGSKRIITAVVARNVEACSMASLATQDSAVSEILDESEMTTEEHEENGVKTTITRVITRKEITEPELMSDKSYREMLQPLQIETEQSAKTETGPFVTSEDKDKNDSIKELFEELKKQGGNAVSDSECDDNGIMVSGVNPKEYKTKLSEPAGEEKISDSQTEENVSYQVTKNEDGTVTTITRVETYSSTFEPMVVEGQTDIVKDMLEKTDEFLVETAPLDEYEEHSDDNVMREVRREVREVTTMEATSELGKVYILLHKYLEIPVNS